MLNEFGCVAHYPITNSLGKNRTSEPYHCLFTNVLKAIHVIKKCLSFDMLVSNGFRLLLPADRDSRSHTL